MLFLDIFTLFNIFIFNSINKLKIFIKKTNYIELLILFNLKINLILNSNKK
jgi:hypothetical protein